MTVAVVVLGLSKGGFAGIGMVSTPLVALVVGPVQAATLMMPIMLAQDAIAVAIYRRTFDRSTLVRLLPGAVIGVVLAYAFASQVPQWAVELVLGAVSLVFSLRQIVQLLRHSALVLHPQKHDRLVA